MKKILPKYYESSRLSRAVAFIIMLFLYITPFAFAKTDPMAVIKNFSDIALAKYEDSLMIAQALDKAIDQLIKDPSPKTFQNAKDAWKEARVPYMKTEVYRFGNSIVDSWEAKVNAWPLDEGLIDYVDINVASGEGDNTLKFANIIAQKELLINGHKVDLTEINPELLEQLHEADGVEANVATGYHAIEFLLWGQDLNKKNSNASGNRPYTDYDLKKCTGGNCDRRAHYLKSASTALLSDLEEMVEAWKEGGKARQEIEKDKTEGISAILSGIGSLSYGELAGERMQLGLLLHDQEEEHDCFSDNTHISHINNVEGIYEAYVGTYKRLNNSVIQGASLSDIVKEKDPKLDLEFKNKLNVTRQEMQEIKKRVDKGEPYDQQISQGNKEGNAVVQKAIDSLLEQSKVISQIVSVLELKNVKIETSQSLDNPSQIFQ